MCCLRQFGLGTGVSSDRTLPVVGTHLLPNLCFSQSLHCPWGYPWLVVLAGVVGVLGDSFIQQEDHLLVVLIALHDDHRHRDAQGGVVLGLLGQLDHHLLQQEGLDDGVQGDIDPLK